MHRFFVDKDNITESNIEIIGEDVKHIKNVLRLDIDSVISICDKEENDYIVKIKEINKHNILCEIIEKYKSKGEPPIEINLYQGIPKSSKMDIIVQKATEIGVRKIIPVITDRTVVKIQDRKKEDKKIDRWQRIAEEAAKQSKRGLIPEVTNILTLKEVVNILTNEDFVLVPYENENQVSLKDVINSYKGKKINILIGPEGGFEESEINELKNINAHIVTLGPRILRTETAGLTTSAIVLYELGDLGVI